MLSTTEGQLFVLLNSDLTPISLQTGLMLRVLTYNFRVCLPGNAMSTFLDSFPTFSGKLLAVPCSARAMLSVVDRTLGSGV